MGRFLEEVEAAALVLVACGLGLAAQVGRAELVPRWGSGWGTGTWRWLAVKPGAGGSHNSSPRLVFGVFCLSYSSGTLLPL